MAWTLDARIPMTVLTDPAALPGALAGGGAAVLADAPAPALPDGIAVMGFDPAQHPARCDCGSCGGRNAAALALDLLFQGRARGSLPWFTRIVALATSQAGQRALDEAFASDALTRARFRLGGP